jgi:GAF domain-containing protein
VVLAHTQDQGILGATAEGTPLLMLLGVTSLLSVPISGGTTGYGVLTLARQAGEGRFEIAELGLAEELGEHLGVAIRVDRMFRHRSAVAEAGLAGRSAAETARMVQGLVTSFSEGQLRDDMTIVVAKVKSPPAGA